MKHATQPAASKQASPKRASRLPARPHPTAAFGLTDCHRLLTREFGDHSPSLITLKRHAAAGELKPLEAPRRSTRGPLYIYARLRDHYAAQIRKPPSRVPAAPVLADDQIVDLVSQAVAQALEPITRGMQEALGDVHRQLSQLAHEVAGLASVRQSLMLKYDAAAAAAHSRADQLHEQLREARRMQEVDIQLRRVLTEIGRLQVAISQAQPGSTQG